MDNQLHGYHQNVLKEIGGIFANLISCGVYTTNSADTCAYVANHSGAEVIVVDNEKQYRKYLKAKEGLKSVKYFIFITESVPAELRGQNVFGWDEFMTIGKLTYEKNKAELELREGKQSPGTVCLYIYTSGTTSMPKACMLTHDCVIAAPYSQLYGYLRTYKTIQCRDRVVSFLPLCHVAAFSMDVVVNILGDSILYFAQPDAMQGSLIKTLQEAKPTLILAVPRVYEKIQERVTLLLAKKNFVVQKMSQWALNVGREATLAQIAKQSNPFGFTLANFMVINKIKQQLGFDQLQLCMVGGAPTKKSTVDFFTSINIKMLGLYGLSETAGLVAYSLPQWIRLYSSGRACCGITLKIHNPDEHGEGEICCRGRANFVGYYKNPKASMDVFDKDGFFHTGDKGYIDSDGYLFVTGRIKELFKTSGGEYVAPLLIETKFQEICPICSNIVAIGDGRNYLTALITLRSQLSKTDGRPTQEINNDYLETIKALGSKAKTLTEASQCPKVLAYIEQCVEKLNKFALSRVQKVRKWKLLPNEFTIEDEEMTPTMKLRRGEINKRYAGIIEELYKDTKL